MISSEIIRSENQSQNLLLQLTHSGLSEYPPSIKKQNKTNYLLTFEKKKKKTTCESFSFLTKISKHET